MTAPDPQIFRLEAASAETRRFNAALIEQLEKAPDQWSLPLETVRRLRAEGRGAFPVPPKSPRAHTLQIEGPAGPVRLRQILPESAAPAGVFLHIHGGGWTFGTADSQDDRLEAIAETTRAAVLSVDYRLAPEHPYPAAPDDCEAAALWLVRECRARYGDLSLAIGGESAGAHLAVLTLLRLRDRHGLTPFDAAALTAGCYDLRLSPSARNWGAEKLVLNTRDLERFTANFLGSEGDPGSPAVSPLLADLVGLPPALFSVGTRDPLLDDTLFMAARWQAAGNPTRLSVHAGGCHVFQAFPLEIARTSNAEIDAFLRAAFETP